MIPWPFFPILTHYSDHPSVRNLDAILMRFASSIDTVKASGIKKTPLISTSPYSKVLGPPVRVALNDLQDELSEASFNDGIKHMGYLLEGTFTSLYSNRLLPKGFDAKQFIQKGVEGKVVVIADGDLIVNEFDPETEEPLALGVEAFSKNTFGNEQLLLNLLDYMVDDAALIETRSRQVKIRPLDKVKVKNERSLMQFINMVLPVLAILLIGVIKWGWRKRKFTQ